MDDFRYFSLIENQDECLTVGEMSKGWHFCLDFDGLLIGPGMTEMSYCTCNPEPVLEKCEHLPDTYKILLEGKLIGTLNPNNDDAILEWKEPVSFTFINRVYQQWEKIRAK